MICLSCWKEMGLVKIWRLFDFWWIDMSFFVVVKVILLLLDDVMLFSNVLVEIGVGFVNVREFGN